MTTNSSVELPEMPICPVEPLLLLVALVLQEDFAQCFPDGAEGLPVGEAGHEDDLVDVADNAPRFCSSSGIR